MPDYLPDKHPVFWHEWRRHVGRKHRHLLLAGYTLLFIALLLLTWLSSTELNKEYTYLYLGCAEIVLALFIPLLTAGVISSEREKGTLEGLFLTPLTNSELILGKFAGAMLPLLTALFACIALNCLAPLFFVNWPVEFLPIYLMLFAIALYNGALSLLVSCFSSRVNTAFKRVYSLTLALNILPMLISTEDIDKIQPKLLWGLPLLSPPASFIICSNSYSMLHNLPLCGLLAILESIVILWLCTRVLRRDRQGTLSRLLLARNDEM